MRTFQSPIVVVAAVCGAVLVSAQGTRQEVEEFLRSSGYTAADLARLDGGEVLAQAGTPDREDEVVASGAVKIRASLQQVAGYYGQMIAYVDGKVTQAFGRFSSPPALADVEGLSLDAAEVEELKSCRPRDCDLRIGGATLAQLRAAVNWSAPDPVAEVNRYLRQAAVAYVADYQKRGDAALITYDDRSRPVSLREQWAGILANAKQLRQYAPELADYAAGYPSRTLTGTRDVFYWSKENFGLKPIISVVHGIIYQPADKPDRLFAVQKQLYASHYYDGSLAIGTILAATENGAPVSYLIYANRSRGDLLKGGFGGLKRSVARKQAESATRETLGAIKRMLEQAPAR